MLCRRVIPCLDVANGRVVKGTRFVDLVDEGDPPELAERYATEGADEIVFLDITAAPEGRGTLLEIVVLPGLVLTKTVGWGLVSLVPFLDGDLGDLIARPLHATCMLAVFFLAAFLPAYVLGWTTRRR